MLDSPHLTRKPHSRVSGRVSVATTRILTGNFSTFSNSIIWTQYMPQYYNQSYAGNFGYQILVALATNFVGYGMAGLTRRFLVYPTYAVWPTSLVTIALNSALHAGNDTSPVRAPFGYKFNASRMKVFGYFFIGMFFYFFFPNYIFPALSSFNWLAWIAPNNVNFTKIVGMNYGLGLNPWSTFDWNIVTFQGDPSFCPLSPFSIKPWERRLVCLSLLVSITPTHGTLHTFPSIQTEYSTVMANTTMSLGRSTTRVISRHPITLNTLKPT